MIKEMVSATTLDYIVKQIYADTFFSGYSHSFSWDPYVGEEIFAEYLFYICEEPTQRMIDLYNSGCFNYYSQRIIKNMVINRYSKVRKNILNFKFSDTEYKKLMKQEDSVDKTLCSEKSKELLKNIDDFLVQYEKENPGGWYDVTLFRMHFNDKMTFRDMEKETRIPYTSLFHSVTKMKDIVQNKFNSIYIDINNN